MTMNLLGFLIGSGLSLGVVTSYSAYRRQRPTLSQRAGNYLGEKQVRPELSDVKTLLDENLLSPLQDALNRLLEYFGSTGPSVKRRLAEANLPWTIKKVRLLQLLSGLAALVLTTLIWGFWHLHSPENPWVFLIVTIICGILGLLAPDRWLTWKAKTRQSQIGMVVPDCAELISLSVAAGEGLVDALTRVRPSIPGPLGEEIEEVLGVVKVGTPLPEALNKLIQRNPDPALNRLTEALLVAIERGTPLAQVLRAQSLDAREAQRRELIEMGGRKEIAMLIPVVFLILPVTILFALYPGLASLKIGF
ncbi:hypothetical protein BSR29_02295 [Boudabousia liubingyangii]|uniref:Type II secretion system protein GspF domain-containing protein n=1 Tax=Boudabousia liubingyangii TaxID=1921764 RepID=A0A1Q5PQX3_9ACTO|nr:hypothetical protein BSR29_02295 [Boudabousia liubingyangii]